MEDNRRAEDMGARKALLIISRFIIHLAVHKMIGVVVYQVIYAVAVSQGPFGLFNYHVFFSVLGYQLLLVEAIMSFNKESSWIRNLPRKIVRLVHLTLGATGGVLSFVGPLLMMIQCGGKFETAHGVCGLIAMLFSVLAVSNGILTFFSPQLRDTFKPATIKAVHTVCGMFALVMGLATLCLGINKSYFAKLVADNTQLVSTLTSFIITILLYVLWHPVMSMIGYVQNMRTTAL